MSLFSFFRKNKQEAPDDDTSYSRAKDEPNPKRPRARRQSASDDAAADQILPEKKRARRRLVGAVALVLAAVIGLPMVLDSEPKPLAQDIDIKIPSKDSPAHQPQSRRLPVPVTASLGPDEQILEPVDGGGAPVAAPDARKPAMPAVVAASDAAERKEAMPAASPKAVAAEPTAAEAKVMARTEPKEKEAAKPEAPASARSAPKAPADEDKEAARAKAILEGKGVTDAGKAPADKKPGKYMIQVAALASQDKINELRSKLKAAGIASQTQKIPTANGERTRVRVGPFASKEEAEKTRARLVKLGLNGSLVPLGE
ncbi:SPOR domain-containing protein [Noviherbaspirillum sedimenti]|uniref:SPOR domain-containing protein n=1 Tax=Noviherbaspirillum sedimenti TaxID=2320865 RepID=A0A3A3FYQ1_9BURK|nr:SPOR domain-containing protein [Noviherbaspirillum sedimenti]RJG00761.1 hypothetical protein D3878_03470 [Noviherbaspirillum sedimenti]